MLTIGMNYTLFHAVGLAILAQNMGMAIVFGGILLLIVYALYRVRLIKNRKRKIIRPVSDILENQPERVKELNKEIEPFGFAYEPYQDIFYSLMNPWQRKLGYCRLYDEASAALSMIIDCEPITFEYDGRRWLVEFWKGQYGMNTGAEVGIYNTSDSNVSIPGLFSGTFYYCVSDEECINMSFILRKKGNLLFTRTGYHWWLTGFKLGEYTKPSDLSMDIELMMYDKKMANVLGNALKEAGYKPDEYQVQGRRVLVRYDKPHMRQPLTRTALTDYLMMRNNNALCDSYNTLTNSYTDTPDKLDMIKNIDPAMYNRMIAIGKPKEVFESYNTIKEYLDQLSDIGKE